MEITVKAMLSAEDMESIAQKVALINAGKFKPEEPDKQQLFTVKEVAVLTKRTPWTIYQHISSKLLTAEKIGKSWLISKNNFDKYTKNGE